MKVLVSVFAVTLLIALTALAVGLWRGNAIASAAAGVSICASLNALLSIIRMFKD
jgi:hypothetical protein